jgi:hypothetical protein
MSLLSTSTTFAGEKWLQAKLPNYEYEYLRLWVLLGFTTGFLALSIVLPYIVASKNRYVVTITTKRIDHQRNEKNMESKKVKNVVVRDVPLYAKVGSFLGIVVALIMITRLVLKSPNNTFVVRRVFEAPLLTESECSLIIDMSERAAERNIVKANETLEDLAKHWKDYEEEPEYIESNLLLEKPQGWQKLRHGKIA